jgi:hypothetical protein
MEPIFIVAGQLRAVDRGLYKDVEKTSPFFHLVQAATASAAESRVHEHYEKKSEAEGGGSPYGMRYYVQEMDAWEQIGELKLL